jgi:hypothetical protein
MTPRCGKTAKKDSSIIHKYFRKASFLNGMLSPVIQIVKEKKEWQSVLF